MSNPMTREERATLRAAVPEREHYTDSEVLALIDTADALEEEVVEWWRATVQMTAERHRAVSRAEEAEANNAALLEAARAVRRWCGAAGLDECHCEDGDCPTCQQVADLDNALESDHPGTALLAWLIDLTSLVETLRGLIRMDAATAADKLAARDAEIARLQRRLEDAEAGARRQGSRR